jgi:hypothetical protein
MTAENTQSQVESAQSIVDGLEAKKQQLIERGRELTEERRKISFLAHTGDAKARAKLDRVIADLAAHGNELASVEDAIIEAKARLNVAAVHASLAADREQALDLRDALLDFCDAGERIDAAFAAIAAAARDFKAAHDRMYALGARTPSYQQIQVLGLLALQTSLMGTPWAREFPHLAPHQRRSFKALVDGWHDQLLPGIAARIGEEKEEAA